ncbi:Glycosyltransferase [Desulfosporosinus sp. I2]|uniref:acyltransferase family protein n=1 Tax=Desulfosporosinus sp. I2 TaxID=1617025 RepID=UPI00061E69F9|nr:acyltransferase family protein [Desulfosporosinus sp. I2]KJR45690.1 Glycosyltransferase [Desulfosporosinus sp. I2]
MGAGNDSELKRIDWVDILKGLGILSVVWGHSGGKNAFYMFWFHMPLFFLVSGYLYQFKPQLTAIAYLKKKAKHLLVPYLFYLTSLTLMMVGISLWKGQPANYFLLENWKALLLGGSLLEGVYATFWFTTCLFSVQICFDYLCRKVPSKFLKGMFVVVCFLLAYWESRYWEGSFVPWNVDVGLYALAFYALGYLMKQRQLMERPTHRTIIFALSLVISLGFIYLYSHQILDYGLDMKHRQYYYEGTNLILPLVFTLLLIKLSMILSKFPLLEYGLVSLGRAAMVIMYLHLASVYLVGHFMAITPLRFFAVGILIPLLFYFIAKRVPYGKFLALGETEAGFGTLVPEISVKKDFDSKFY